MIDAIIRRRTGARRAGSAPPRETDAPRGGLRLRLVAASATLALAGACGGGAAAPSATDFLTGLSGGPSSPETTLGDRHTFGSVDGLGVLAPGVEVVSDATDGHLKLFAASRETGSFGRVGSGPEDFSTLGAVVPLRADTFVVLDPNRGRLVTFRRTDDSVARVAAIDLPFPVSGACALAGRLYALGRYDSTLVHEITTGGEIVRSFGPLEGVTSFEVGLDAAAEIGCSPAADAIALASRVPGELRIFSASGALIRRDSIPAFSRSRYAGAQAATATDTSTARSWNVVEGVQWFGTSLLVQLGRYPMPDSHGLESRWLSASGEWKTGLRAWPRILAHTEDGRVYTATHGPNPIVNVYWVARTE